MNRFLKLVHMEVYRFRYILAGLMSVTALLQIVALLVTLHYELINRKDPTHHNYNEALSFARSITNLDFMIAISILLCVVVMVLYIFIIWYRDFIGRSTFIYRLLMLPTARAHIYLAKATAILIFSCSLLSFQLFMLVVENVLYKLIVPTSLQISSTFAEITRASLVLKELFPVNVEQFFIILGLGILAVFVIFTAIIFERSYRLVGIIIGIVYIVICSFIVTVPIVFLGIDQSITYFYPGELLAIEILLCFIVLASSLLLGFWHLAKKIKV